MRFLFGVCLIAAGMVAMVAAQDSKKPVLRPGIAVQMPVASEAVAMPAADELNATVITVTAEGMLVLGTQPITADALPRVPVSTVYVKADARVPYQQVLSVLNALNGRSVVLLTAATVKAEAGKITAPYGIRLAVGGKAAE